MLEILASRELVALLVSAGIRRLILLRDQGRHVFDRGWAKPSRDARENRIARRAVAMSATSMA
jgi:hypothetical protein